jgi:hypothetical protein
MTQSPFGRALSPVETQQSRYLDALIAFRPETCLRMEDAPKADPPAGDPPKADPPKADPPKADADGFPANTPVVEMTAPQQAAYYKHQAQKHEARNKDLLAITGGKHGDDLKAVFDEYGQLKTASLTDGEKALEEAKKQTRAEVALESVRSSFDLLLPDDMPAEKKQEALEVLNLAAFLTSDGKVDTAKVKTHAATLAPAKDNGQQQNRRDWGGGRRETGGAPLGASGAAEAERRFGKPTTS